MLEEIKKQFLYYIEYFKRKRKKDGGLVDEIDERDFGAHIIAGEATKDDLTEEDFRVGTFVHIDQKDTDFCVGCSRAYGAQLTEKRNMSWAGAFALAKSIDGTYYGWGTSILSMCKAAVKYGTPEESYWQYTGSRNYSANWYNFSTEVYDNAAEHKAGSYFRIYLNGMDQFDTFRAYLNKFRGQKLVIHTGVDAHAVTLIGQERMDGEIHLVGIDSFGKKELNYRVGKSKEGYRYFNRREANMLFNGYLLFDMERSVAELLKEYNEKAVKVEGDNNCYLIKDGKRHFLANEIIAWSHNTLLFDPNYVYEIKADEMDKIPLGEPAKFKEGKNWEIVARILEKYGKQDELNNLI